MRQITKHNRAGKKKNRISLIACMLVLVFLMTGCGKNSDGVIRITNVSYDPTREFYEAYNSLFEKYYEDTYGKKVEVIQSHGGSGAQARSVVEGCNADVVTLALEHDITLIEQTGLIDKGWQKEFDKDSAPYTSTIVFLVRKGNPKNIRDWDDLIQKNVEVITPDPKSSGGACWNFLAALSYAKEHYTEKAQQKEFMRKLYQQVSVMDSGARGSTTTFVENKKGDVLIAWENEAIASMKSYPGEYELINPSVSILAQPSVAIVDDNANDNGIRSKITADGIMHTRCILTMEQCLMKSTTSKKTKKVRVIPGYHLTLGITVTMLSLIVLIPLASVLVYALKLSPSEFFRLVTKPNILHAFRTSILCSLVAALINCIFGVIIAWVLVKYDFPGKRILDGCIELPFALPTAVAGITLSKMYSETGILGKPLASLGIKVSYTHLGLIIALIFIGIPFVIRAVQPVLEKLDGQYEEAAFMLGASRMQTFYKVIIPELRPAILTGFGLAFARGIGEYGSVIYISGNSAREQTQVVSYVIMQKLGYIDYASATAIALVMLILSFLILLAVNIVQMRQSARTNIL